MRLRNYVSTSYVHISATPVSGTFSPVSVRMGRWSPFQSPAQVVFPAAGTIESTHTPVYPVLIPVHSRSRSGFVVVSPSQERQAGRHAGTQARRQGGSPPRMIVINPWGPAVGGQGGSTNTLLDTIMRLMIGLHRPNPPPLLGPSAPS
jgi:hypothetical protein